MHGDTNLYQTCSMAHSYGLWTYPTVEQASNYNQIHFLFRWHLLVAFSIPLSSWRPQYEQKTQTSVSFVAARGICGFRRIRVLAANCRCDKSSVGRWDGPRKLEMVDLKNIMKHHGTPWPHMFCSSIIMIHHDLSQNTSEYLRNPQLEISWNISCFQYSLL